MTISETCVVIRFQDFNATTEVISIANEILLSQFREMIAILCMPTCKKY